MTLMLASIRPDDVVITADGRSTTRTHGAVTGIDDHFQKLFPVPDHPVVIGHLGMSDFGRMGLAAFLADFIRHLNVGNYTIEEISDELRHFAHPLIRRRFKSVEEVGPQCAFWVAGFGAGDDKPMLVENCWVWKHDVLSCEERQCVPVAVFEGGDGQKQIHPATWKAVKGKSIEQVREYHKSLMDEAINANVKDNCVGGHVHELVITREEWKWTQPPIAHDHEAPSTQPTTTQPARD